MFQVQMASDTHKASLHMKMPCSSEQGISVLETRFLLNLGPDFFKRCCRLMEQFLLFSADLRLDDLDHTVSSDHGRKRE